VTGTARVVLVEDDPAVAELVTLYLRNAGFAVTHAPTAGEARRLFAEVRPAVVILDLGLPDADGSAVFRELRARSDVPVIALTARAEEKLSGLEAGMDDFVTKPFDPRELVARVRSVVRRATGVPGGGRVLEVGDVRLDPSRHEVSVGGRPVQLRAKEFELLEAFMRQPGVVLSRDKLLEQVWGFAFPGETRTVDVHVKQVRDKLEGASARIETVWGVGYKLVAPEAGS
jgi:DNA-binding response OmpR family regulator